MVAAMRIFLISGLLTSIFVDVLSNPSERRAAAKREWQSSPNLNMPPNTGLPVNVSVSIYVQEMEIDSDLSPVSKLHSNLLLRVSWKDSRLRHTQDPRVTVPRSWAGDLFWCPVVIFDRAEHIPFSGGVVYVNTDGTVWISERKLVTSPCSLTFARFPFDEQNCYLRLTTDSLSSELVEISFQKDSVQFDKECVISDWHLTKFSTQLLHVNHSVSAVDTMIIHFGLRRHFGKYIKAIFAPGIGFLLMMCTVFWIPGSKPLIRSIYSLVWLAAMFWLITEARSISPSVNYVTAFDVFVTFHFGLCLVAVLYFLLNICCTHTPHGGLEKAEPITVERGGCSRMSGRCLSFVDWLFRLLFLGICVSCEAIFFIFYAC